MAQLATSSRQARSRVLSHQLLEPALARHVVPGPGVRWGKWAMERALPSPGGLCATQGGPCEQRPRGIRPLPPSHHVCGMTLTSSTLLGRREGGSEVPGQWLTSMTCGPGLAARLQRQEARFRGDAPATRRAVRSGPGRHSQPGACTAWTEQEDGQDLGEALQRPLRPGTGVCTQRPAPSRGPKPRHWPFQHQLQQRQDLPGLPPRRTAWPHPRPEPRLPHTPAASTLTGRAQRLRRARPRLTRLSAHPIPHTQLRTQPVPPSPSTEPPSLLPPGHGHGAASLSDCPPSDPLPSPH